MTTTVHRPRVRPGSIHLQLPGPLDKLPEALTLLTGRSRIVMLPPRWAGEPQAYCLCNGELVYVRGAWRHSDTCLACWNAPASAEACTERHIGCSRPEPRECEHRCGGLAVLTDRCAWDGAEASCCNCCWDLLARPDLDGVSHKRR